MWMFLDANYNYNYNYSYSYSYSYSNRYIHKNKTISISIQLTWSGAAENGALDAGFLRATRRGAYALMDHIYFFIFLFFSFL